MILHECHSPHRQPPAIPTSRWWSRLAPAIRLGTAAELTLLLAACSTQYHFKIDALRSQQPFVQPHSYRLHNAIADAAIPDRGFQKIARHIHTALSARGMFEAPINTVPDIDVDVEFTVIGPLKVVRTRDEPVFAEAPPTPIPLSARIGSVPVNLPPQPRGPVRIGERTVVYTVSVYQKLLRLTARASGNGMDRAGPELWQVSVFSEDKSGDIPLYARLMTAAALDHIASDTVTTRDIVLTRRDECVSFIEAGARN